VADAVGVHSAFLVVPVFAVIAIVLIRRYRCGTTPSPSPARPVEQRRGVPGSP
jgi:hypothetical protein